MVHPTPASPSPGRRLRAPRGISALRHPARRHCPPNTPSVCPLKSTTRHDHPTSHDPRLLTPHPWPPPPLPCPFSARPSPQPSSRASQHRPSPLASSHGDPVALFPQVTIRGRRLPRTSSASPSPSALPITCSPPKGAIQRDPDPDGLRSHLPRSCTVSGRGSVGQRAFVLRDPTSFSTDFLHPRGPKACPSPSFSPYPVAENSSPSAHWGDPFPGPALTLQPACLPPNPVRACLRPPRPPAAPTGSPVPRPTDPTAPARTTQVPWADHTGRSLGFTTHWQGRDRPAPSSQPPLPPRRNPPSPHRAPCLCQSLRAAGNPRFPTDSLPTNSTDPLLSPAPRGAETQVVTLFRSGAPRPTALHRVTSLPPRLERCHAVVHGEQPALALLHHPLGPCSLVSGAAHAPRGTLWGRHRNSALSPTCLVLGAIGLLSSPTPRAWFYPRAFASTLN